MVDVSKILASRPWLRRFIFAAHFHVPGPGPSQPCRTKRVRQNLPSAPCLPIPLPSPIFAIISNHSSRLLSKNMRNRQEQTCSTIVSSSSCKAATLRTPSTPSSKSKHKRFISFEVTTENSPGGSSGLSTFCTRSPPAVLLVQSSV